MSRHAPLFVSYFTYLLVQYLPAPSEIQLIMNVGRKITFKDLCWETGMHAKDCFDPRDWEMA